jgi:hypothetical protein
MNLTLFIDVFFKIVLILNIISFSFYLYTIDEQKGNFIYKCASLLFAFFLGSIVVPQYIYAKIKKGTRKNEENLKERESKK